MESQQSYTIVSLGKSHLCTTCHSIFISSSHAKTRRSQKSAKSPHTLKAWMFCTPESYHPIADCTRQLLSDVRLKKAKFRFRESLCPQTHLVYPSYSSDWLSVRCQISRNRENRKETEQPLSHYLMENIRCSWYSENCFDFYDKTLR